MSSSKPAVRVRGPSLGNDVRPDFWPPCLLYEHESLLALPFWGGLLSGFQET